MVEEAENNPEFATILRAHFGTKGTKRKGNRRRAGHRRTPGVIDPFLVRKEGEEALREALDRLTLDQLKDIVAEHGMDPGKLAMKWRTSGRLIDFIVETVELRRRKGSAFRE